MNEKIRPNLQAHCQSPTSQPFNQSFVKELANAILGSPKGLFAISQKNKINLCFMDRLVRILNDDLKCTER